MLVLLTMMEAWSTFHPWTGERDGWLVPGACVCWRHARVDNDKSSEKLSSLEPNEISPSAECGVLEC